MWWGRGGPHGWLKALPSSALSGSSWVETIDVSDEAPGVRWGRRGITGLCKTLYLQWYHISFIEPC